MAEALGEKDKGLTLMNHGLLTVGGTVDEAAYMFRLIERAVRSSKWPMLLLPTGSGSKSSTMKKQPTASRWQATRSVHLLRGKLYPAHLLTKARKASIAGFGGSMSTICSSMKAHLKLDTGLRNQSA